ncbi:MAG: WYL domain-containing protein [Desulfovibrio sp.]|nr:WYL domain-containing protein [Desulfovibrio sp.]
MKYYDGVGLQNGFQAADSYELISWLFSFGNGAELPEPEHLRLQIREEMEEMRGMYAEEEGEGGG